MMKAGGGANEFITVLIYVLLFGGAIVGEIVKHIRKKQAQRRLEEQLASGRPPQEPEAEIIEEREVEEEEEGPREAEMPKEVPREVREIFEEVFGPTFGKNIPAEPQPPLRPSRVIKPETLEVVLDEPTEKPLVNLQHLGSFKHAELKPSETPVALEKISLGKRIFKDLELSDMQKLIVYSEILGKPKALRITNRRITNRIA